MSFKEGNCVVLDNCTFNPTLPYNVSNIEKLEEIEENKKKIAQAEVNNNEGNTAKTQNVNEETADYIKAGNFKLEYGTYTSNLGENQAKAGSYILNKDKSFQYTNTWKDSTNTPHQINITGTYSIYYSEDIDVEGWIIKFTSNSDESMGNTLYSINSNNSFEGIQYPNTFSLGKNDNTLNRHIQNYHFHLLLIPFRCPILYCYLPL